MTDTDFSKATERPWKQHLVDSTLIVSASGGAIVAKVEGDYDTGWQEMEANAGLIVAAVNAFDPEREKKVEALVVDNERLFGALQKIANGDGVYGAQAHEYKQTARAAIAGCAATRETADKVIEALEEAEEYFDNRADADQPPGSVPIPNKEMVLLCAVREALHSLKGGDNG